MDRPETTFWDVVDGIRERDPAYGREAYGFVVAALGVVADGLPAERRKDPARRHLTGQELVQGVIALARREFGAMGPTVFSEWQVRSSEDVGRMVFQLVEAGQLSARPEDTLEDFRGGLDLLEALGSGLEPGSGLPRERRGPRARHRAADTP